MCMNIFHTQAANVGERFRQNLSSPDSLRSNFEMAGSVRAKLPGVTPGVSPGKKWHSHSWAWRRPTSLRDEDLVASVTLSRAH